MMFDSLSDIVNAFQMTNIIGDYKLKVGGIMLSTSTQRPSLTCSVPCECS